jgi:hypothetical protein
VLDRIGRRHHAGSVVNRACAIVRSNDLEKKSRAESPALKIVSTLFSPKFGFDLD